MILPFRDENPTRRFPYVTLILIAINVAVFAYQQSLSWTYPEFKTPVVDATGQQVLVPDGGEVLFLYGLGLIPREWTHLQRVEPNLYELNGDLVVLAPNQGLAIGARLSEDTSSRVLSQFAFLKIPGVFNIFTNLFVHGGWLHIIGNMLFLWIFGDNIEDRLGHLRYLLFYMGCGLAGNVGHILVSLGSFVPTVGASGAVAGVMGAYMHLFPHARITCIWWLCLIVRVVAVPAGFVLGFWIVLQVINAMLSFGATAGVAWMAHIAGFAAGYFVVRRWFRRRQLRARFY